MKIFSTKRDKIMILVILLVIIFFFGLKSYFKIDEQNEETVDFINVRRIEKQREKQHANRNSEKRKHSSEES